MANIPEVPSLPVEPAQNYGQEIRVDPGITNVLIPSAISALQSSSYVLILLIGYLAFSSRKYVTQFLKAHLELMERLKDDVDKQTLAGEKHVAILEQLHDNYKQLNQIIDLRLQAYLQRFEDTVKKAIDDHEETKH